jgi:hypothetical protein
MGGLGVGCSIFFGSRTGQLEQFGLEYDQPQGSHGSSGIRQGGTKSR